MVTLVETPHPISPYIAQAREATTDVLGGARGYVEEGVSKWIGFEKRVERESTSQGRVGRRTRLEG
jgi:organizing structure protein 2